MPTQSYLSVLIIHCTIDTPASCRNKACTRQPLLIVARVLACTKWCKSSKGVLLWYGNPCHLYKLTALVALITYMSLLPYYLSHGHHLRVYELSGLDFLDHPFSFISNHNPIPTTCLLPHPSSSELTPYPTLCKYPPLSTSTHHPFAPTDISAFPITIDHGLSW